MIKPFAAMTSTRSRIALAAIAIACSQIVPVHFAASEAGALQAEQRSSYVLLSQGSRSSTMSGSMDDLQRAQSLRRGNEALLYVRHGGTAYVIRDAATLRQAEEIFEPQRALGARQGALGAQQAELGRRQARLGAEQGRLGRLQAAATPGRAGDLGRRQAALGSQQNALGREQNALGQRQAELGREQERLGRVAEGRLRALVADAVRRGVAQRVD